MTCPSGLFQYDTHHKAQLAARKRKFESQGMRRYAVPSEPCQRCGHFHIFRSE